MAQRVQIGKGVYDVFMGRQPWAVRVGWTGPGANGEWGNYLYDVKAHRRAFLIRVAEDAPFRQAVEGLRGKRLGCFCKPGKSCHVDVIVEYLTPKEDEDALLAALAARLAGED